MHVEKYSAIEWTTMGEYAHRYCFNENRPAEMNRIDYALLAVEDGVPLAYLTARELDNESVYWQYGGALKSSEKSVKVLKAYQMFIETMKKGGMKRISTLIQNNNLPMLKMAMHCGFRIIGVRLFKNEIFCELLNEFEGEN